MNVNLDEKKEEYWNHFLKLKKYWPVGFTLKRLEKIKPVIWKDTEFWDDILWRHGGHEISPEAMKNGAMYNYQHCFGNFAGMILNDMVREGIIKP